MLEEKDEGETTAAIDMDDDGDDGENCDPNTLDITVLNRDTLEKLAPRCLPYSPHKPMLALLIS
jgi:hypothetical protein